MVVRAPNKNQGECSEMKSYVVLTLLISSPVEQFCLKTPYVKCVLNFITLLHPLAKDVSKSP